MTEKDPYQEKVLNLLMTIGENTKPKPVTPESSKEAALKHVLECKDCYPKVKAAVIEKEFKNKDYNCVGCGLPVGKEGLETKWECPGCGNIHVNKRESGT